VERGDPRRMTRFGESLISLSVMLDWNGCEIAVFCFRAK
jgi:hypothetical protein